jgi:hypothetical protein
VLVTIDRSALERLHFPLWILSRRRSAFDAGDPRHRDRETINNQEF